MPPNDNSFVFVSGATGDVGTAVAHELAAAGHHLFVTARNSDRLQRLERSLVACAAGTVRYAAADFAQPTSVAALRDTLRTSTSSCSGCVLIYPRTDKPAGPFVEPQVWHDNWERCFVQPLALLESVVEYMQPGAKVVVVSGIAALQVFEGLYVTNAIRTAWLAQVKTLAFALGKRGIHINTVALGALDTPRIRDTAAARREVAGSALGRMGAPASVARTIAMMLGPMADHLSGAVIPCDGGFVRNYA